MSGQHYNYLSLSDKTPGTKLTMEFETEDLEVVLSEFQDFLRGLGFYFDGQLEIVNDTDANTIDLVPDENYYEEDIF